MKRDRIFLAREPIDPVELRRRYFSSMSWRSFVNMLDDLCINAVQDAEGNMYLFRGHVFRNLPAMFMYRDLHKLSKRLDRPVAVTVVNSIGLGISTSDVIKEILQ